MTSGQEKRGEAIIKELREISPSCGSFINDKCNYIFKPILNRRSLKIVREPSIRDNRPFPPPNQGIGPLIPQLDDFRSSMNLIMMRDILDILIE